MLRLGILAAAGLLDGKRATSHWVALPTLKAFGVKPVGDERIVHEGDIVTCAGVSAGIDLGLWLAGQIAGEGRAKAIQLSIEYDPQPPFDSGHMSKASAEQPRRRHRADVEGPGQARAAEGRRRAAAWDQAIERARSKAAASPP